MAIFINGAFTKLTRFKGPVIVYRRGKDLGQNKVKFSRYPFEYYFTEVIPLTTFDDFRNPPPTPVFIFQANLSDPSSEFFRSFQRSRLFGSQLRLIPLLFSQKSSDPP